jgi:hypothetical protein
VFIIFEGASVTHKKWGEGKITSISTQHVETIKSNVPKKFMQDFIRGYER